MPHVPRSYGSPVLSNSYAILFNAPGATATSVNTIATNPSGVPVTIDGVATPTPAVVSWVPGQSHTPSVATPQTNGGTETTLTSWSTGDTTPQISVVAAGSGTTYTATFGTKYELTTSASPSSEGAVSGNGQFYDSGDSVTVTATPTAPYVFKGFSGDLTGTTNPQNLTMNGPKNITATFGPAYACSVSNGASATVADVQALINEALGTASPGNDVNNDKVVSVVDVQIVMNAAMGRGCTT